MNSFLVYKESHPTFTNESAKLVLVSLLKSFLTSQTAITPQPADECDYDSDEKIRADCYNKHIPVRSEAQIEADRRRPFLGHFLRFVEDHCQRKRCTVCNARSISYCSYCGTFLCKKYCFEMFHRLAHYK